MKKIAVLFAFAVAFAVGSASAHAQVATTTAPMNMGGYGTPCFYLRQANEWVKGYVCNDADYSSFKFATDPLYRASIIGPWNYHIFVEVARKYGWVK